MNTIISHSAGSIVVKCKSKEVAKYNVTKHIKDYGIIVRESRKEADE